MTTPHLPEGIDQPLWDALLQLAARMEVERDGLLTEIDIIQHLGVSRPTACRLIDFLVEASAKNPDPDERWDKVDCLRRTR
jgi:hypothetical protein